MWRVLPKAVKPLRGGDIHTDAHSSTSFLPSPGNNTSAEKIHVTDNLPVKLCKFRLAIKNMYIVQVRNIQYCLFSRFYLVLSCSIWSCLACVVSSLVFCLNSLLLSVLVSGLFSGLVFWSRFRSSLW
jgi:hypothetical protein